ncbi:glycosyltransferase [Candidatus Microgenomates bacterium]|nr:MAG: glycosyltransferase [Candidatus Microgenomates bacterium]
MKKILMISYHTCPLANEEGKETGGMNIYVHELGKHLGQLGFIVDAITRSQDKNNQQIVPVSKNFRVIHLKAGPEKVINKKKLPDYIPEFISAFRQFSQEQQLNYDLLHGHYYQSGLVGLKLNKSKKPLVITFHTLALMKNLVARSPSEMDRPERIMAEFTIAQKADRLIAASENEKQYLHYLYNAKREKISEIAPGINIELFKPIDKRTAKQHINAKKDEKIILFVGRIEPLKGIDALLYALKIIRTDWQNCPIKLLIVGGDVSQHIAKWSPQLQQLQQLTQTLNIEPAVEFVGQKPQHELPFYYNAAELVVMPSHYESFGMTAAESMACGTPVIMSNVTGISNLIDDVRKKQITTVNNPLLLARQIKTLLTEKDTYAQVRAHGLEQAQELTWASTAQRFANLYEQLLA